MVVYRETIQANFDQISTLLEEAKIREPYFTKDRFERMLETNAGFFHVAEDQGKIIGSVFATHDGAFVGYLRKLAVKESYRRQGVASNLVRAAIGKLEEAGIPLIFALVEKTNEASIGLFQSLGFQVRGSYYLIQKI